MRTAAAGRGWLRPGTLLMLALGVTDGLSARAWQCIATPYFDKIRVVWIINMSLIAMLLVGVGWFSDIFVKILKFG